MRMKLKFSSLVLGYKRLGRTLAISPPLSGELEMGRTYVLLGPNGAGKSTLLKTLSGLLPPLSGTVHLDHRSIQDLSPRERSRFFSLYLGERGVWGRLTVEELFLITQERCPVTPQRVETVVKRFGVEQFWEKRLNELSEGERKRVLLARAFLPQVPFLFLDEPLSHLDFWQKEEILRLIFTPDEERSILMTTHDLNALSIAEELWFLPKGGALMNLPKGIASDSLLTLNYLEQITPQS